LALTLIVARRRLEAKHAGRQASAPPAVREDFVVGKKEIVQSISRDLGLTHKETHQIVQKVLDGVVQSLVNRGRVELRNFGVFEVKQRKPRMARNPKTGEKVMVPKKLSVTFKPGLVIQQRVESLSMRDQDVAEGTSPTTAQADPAATF
jgi:integration host factor subunit beta